MKKVKVIYNEEDEFAEGSEEKVVESETTEVANKINKNLLRMEYQSKIIEVSKDTINKTIEGIGQDDLIFNYCEWTGNDYEVEVEMLKMIAERKLTYTGVSWKEYLWMGDKRLMKKKITGGGFPMLKSWSVINISEAEQVMKEIEKYFPVIIKTTKEHCSIGLDEDSVVGTRDGLIKKVNELINKYQQPVMIEEFAEGNEYQVFVFESGSRPVSLPVYETLYKKTDKPALVTFKDNWYGGSFFDKVVRVGVTKDAVKDTTIRSLAVEIFNKLRVKGYTRVDFREKSGKLFILELNSNPALGWTEEWDFIKVCAEAAGMTYTDVLKLVISGARPGV